MPTFSDFALVSSAALVGTWIRLTHNVTGVTYVSTAATTSSGAFTVNNVPAGIYSLATGPTNIGPWTTVDTAYVVGPDLRWYNVRDYGAVGDGSTDDTAAIQAALNDCRSNGGGTVYFPPTPTSVYMVNTANRTGGFANNFCALMYSPNTTITGPGVTIRLVAGASGNTTFGTTSTSMFSPWNVSQENVTFSDITIDGNAGNQTDTHHGVFVWRQRRVKMHRVRILNVRGTSNAGGAAETFMFYGNGSGDLSFVDCDAIQTAGSVSNGFVANGCTNVDYVNCRAANIGNGASIGYGFNVGTSSAGSRQVSYTNCHSYLCGQQGYHIDASDVQNVTYTNCTAGGVASNLVSGQQYPFTSGQSLGNGGSGWVCTVAAVGIKLIGCTSDNNGTHGFDLRAGQFYLDNCSARNNAAGDGVAFSNAPTARVWGGDYSSNAIGIRIAAVADTTTIAISGKPRMTGNTTAAWQVNATNYSAAPANVAAPAIPASTVAQTNPFGFDALVYVNAGTVSAVAINGVATGQTTNMAYFVPATGSITLTYTVVPTSWTWYIV